MWEAIRRGDWKAALDTLEDILKYANDPKVSTTALTRVYIASFEGTDFDAQLP